MADAARVRSADVGIWRDRDRPTSRWRRIYVPGHIRDGIYIRPHFVSAPKLEYRAWPAEPRAVEPEAKPEKPPLLDLAPTPERSKLGEPF